MGCLITAEQLSERVESGECTVIDCRFELADTSAGYAAYLEGHVPGAVYASLDADLSSAPATDCGRHPLPKPEDIQKTFARLGVSDGRPVALYDAQGGMVAARGWWMLRYIGHSQVAVVDGGWMAWLEAGSDIERGEVHAEPGHLTMAPDLQRLITYADLRSDMQLVDAREPRRFRGEYEPIDARAGHIPGAENHFFQHNLAESGEFLPPDEIRDRFQESLGRIPDEQTVHYCGSGVSACHNILAQVHAGLPEPKLYCGSWSEWAQLTAENEGSDERS